MQLLSKHRPLERGVLTIFRMIILFRLVLWIYAGLIVGGVALFPYELAPVDWLLLAADALLLFVLFRFPKRAEKWLSALLLFSVISQFVQTYVAVGDSALPFLAERAVNPLVLTADLILWTVLIAWQYNFRVVVVFELGVLLIDFALLNWFVPSATAMYWLTVEDLLIRSAVHLIIGYSITQLVGRMRAQRAALREANVQLVNYAATAEQLAVTEERNRLAHELHDTLAHSLSGLSVQLEAATSLWDIDPATAQHMLNGANETARGGLTEARRALNALRAAPLEELGLLSALRQLAAASAEPPVTLRLPAAAPQLPPAAEHAIFRIAQEALTNARRHADATAITLTLAQSADALTLTVIDNGSGFEMGADIGRWGLKGMHERATMIGGTLTINSTLGQGTTIVLAIPSAAVGVGHRGMI